ncbi:unnamed protein product [Adineta steineri]|uniref:IMD domain-containing protein n=1 Tax=Adineta steineri TaxID=433720 RepID=A0A819F2Q2_9BILA|nr:unnamed protein product [Adineta steineri]CAF3860185.1 unnamed protein product [Adineta steineri]
MNIIENAEKECAVLGSLFQGIVNEMKNSSTLWEDLVSKANKMHIQLKSTIITFSLFLDAFQRIADLATNTKGATRDIGTALTRLILRHKSIEQKLKYFTNSLVETFIQPLNDCIEDWKKSANTLDKDHAKGLKDYKKLRNELRKKASETVKLQKKCRKLPKHDILHNKLNSAIQEVSNYYGMLEEREKQALRSAMIEERSHFCTLFTLLKPVMDLEISVASEMSHIEDLVQCLSKHTIDPHCLPISSEQVIKDVKGIDYSTIVAFKTPPSSPSSLSSRKSSVCSINSINSSSSNSLNNAHSPNHKQGHHHHHHQQQQQQQYQQPQLSIPIQHQFYHSNTNRSLSMPSNVAVSRISSVSSQDSGFTSQEQFFARPPSPLEESEREIDGSTSPLLVVSSTLNAWAKRPEISSNCKHPATVTGAPEPIKSCRPAITAHTFDPPPASLFEKPNWQIYEETNPRITTISDDSTLSRQHSVPSRRCRMRDLSLERSSINNISNGRIKPTQPPIVPQDYYGTIINRHSPEDINQRLRNGSLPNETMIIDPRTIAWRDRSNQNGNYYGRPSFESADETLDEMYEYLTKSIHPTNQQYKNETLRRGTSIVSNSNEKPAPPIRRTPSINTNNNQHINDSLMKAHLKCTQEILQLNNHDDFPPPPPDFLLSNDSKPTISPTKPTTTTNPQSSLLAEIQRGGFKLLICSSLIVALALLVGSTIQADSSYPSRYLTKKSNEPESRIEPVTTTLIVSALAPVVLNLFTGLLGNLFNKPNDIEERVIYGRPMQVKLCGVENCIQVLDKGSGITTVGKGDNVQHALGDAVGAMLTSLLERNLLSMHDLCREHIHFPHPDRENCPNVEINTCELSKPVLPQPVCMDSHGAAYCKKMKSHCNESMYAEFMKHNCYKTCSNDCAKPPQGPCDY